MKEPLARWHSNSLDGGWVERELSNKRKQCYTSCILSLIPFLCCSSSHSAKEETQERRPCTLKNTWGRLFYELYPTVAIHEWDALVQLGTHYPIPFSCLLSSSFTDLLVLRALSSKTLIQFEGGQEWASSACSPLNSNHIHGSIHSSIHADGAG